MSYHEDDEEFYDDEDDGEDWCASCGEERPCDCDENGCDDD